MIDRNELVTALTGVIPGIEKGEFLLDGSDSFSFAGGAVRTFNGTLSISYPCETGITGRVKAQEFFNVLSRMEGLSVEIKTENGSVTVSDVKTTLQMPLMDEMKAELFPAVPKEFAPMPEDFQSALKAVESAMAKETTFANLSGIRVEGKDVFATDNFRIGWFILSQEIPHQFLLPKKAVLQVMKLTDLKTYAVTDGWVHFRNDKGVIFSSRTVGADFPSAAIRKLFATPLEESKKYKFPDLLKESIRRAGILSYSNDSGFAFLRLYTEGKNLIVEGKNDTGTVKDRLPAEGIPDGVEMKVSGKFLTEFLNISNEFHFQGGLIRFETPTLKFLISTVKK